MTYTNRVVDDELLSRLSASGAVLIEGAKACGKTETARRAAASEVLLDIDTAAREAAAIDPSLVLDGAAPRLIDEWQLEPGIWNHVRRAVDDRGKPGQFILTGSAVPADDATRHTGAGRISRLRMRPMSLFEAGYSTGGLSLARLLASGEAKCPDPGLTVAEVAERVAVGGWPGHSGPAERSIRANRDYLEEIRRVDVDRIAPRRDPNRIGRLLRSLGRNASTYASIATLAGDTGGADGLLDRETVRGYLDALDRLMIVEDQPPWSPRLRSRSVMRSSAKRHFVDPSLAVAALRVGPAQLLRDLRLLGFLFESLVVRDLRIYSQTLDAQVLQYRDNTGLEVDAIVELPDGDWAAFEVKLGAGQVDEGAASLLTLARRVDADVNGKPLLLGVIVGSGYGYVRPDGVAVIPVGALGP
jgi:predicted AAA+ superfamily ATPase